MTQVKIYPSDDSYTNEASAATNYGSGVDMRIQGEVNNKKHMFLKWSAAQISASIPLGQKIDNAVLYISVRVADADITACETYVCNADWTEGAIIWTGQPSTSGSNLHTFNFGSTGFKNCGGDLKTIFSNWYLGIGNNYGITIRYPGAGLGISEISAKETTGTDSDPYFLVDYSPAPSGFFFFMSE